MLLSLSASCFYRYTSFDSHGLTIHKCLVGIIYIIISISMLSHLIQHHLYAANNRSFISINNMLFILYSYLSSVIYFYLFVFLFIFRIADVQKCETVVT